MANLSTPYRTFLAIVVAGVSLTCAGCVHRNIVGVLPAPPPEPQTERPMNVAPDTDALPPQPPTPAPPRLSEETTPPALAEDIPAMTMPSAPPRPSERPSEQRQAESSDHTPAPQIVPQVSPADQQNYERQTNSDVNVAQQNLSQAERRQLNPLQKNMADQVRSFLKQADDASKAGNWAGAQNLAHKARLLSAELVSSL